MKSSSYDLNASDLSINSVPVFKNNSKFKGTQRNAKRKYEVQVTMKIVDILEGYACGYMDTFGMIKENESITSFFEAEIIGPKHSHITAKWEADKKIDMAHWSKLPGYNPDFVQVPTGNINSKDFLFMRWKESFLIPDHSQILVNGSLAGFYYISLDMNAGNIKGYHFKKSSHNWFEEISLEYIIPTTFSEFQLH